MADQCFMLIKITLINIFESLRVRNRKQEGYLSVSINTATLDPEKPDEFERSNRTIKKSANMNTTVNGSSCLGPFNSTAAKIGQNFAGCLIVVISLLGNCFIAIIVYKTQSLRKPINFFIVNMAMSDLLFPVFVFLQQLTYLYADWLISGPLGQSLCKVAPIVVCVSFGVSVQNLLLIAVDRFGAVVFPLRSPLISSKLCPFFILGTWTLMISAASPNISAWKPTEYQGQLFCILRRNEKYILAVFVVFLYFPIVMLTILYSITVIKLKSQNIPGEQSAISEQQRAKGNKNVLKMAIAIVLGFVLCWVPWSIGMLLSYLHGTLCLVASVFYYIAWFMAVSNCAINPCICFIFNTNYLSSLKSLLNCLRGATVSVNGAAQRVMLQNSHRNPASGSQNVHPFKSSTFTSLAFVTLNHFLAIGNGS